MPTLRILHISDLHERAPFPGMPADREALLEWDAEERGYVLGPKFLEAVQDLSRGGIDLVCFTGDVADWGHPQEYIKAGERFAKILKAVNVPVERFFAVPGNHDVQRKVQEGAWKGLREWHADTHDGGRLGRWLRDVEAAPKGISADWREQVLERTAEFWKWLGEFGRSDLRPCAPKRLGFRSTLRFRHIGVPIHVVGLDSSWLCGADDDQGHILLTEEQVQAHIRDGEKGLDGVCVALIHHPLDHLADCSEVSQILAEGVDLLLHGHQHTPMARMTVEPGARLRVIAAGCLMEGERGKNWPNGFQLIAMDVPPGSIVVHFRKWARLRKFWTAASDVYEDARDGILTWQDAMFARGTLANHRTAAVTGPSGNLGVGNSWRVPQDEAIRNIRKYFAKYARFQLIGVDPNGGAIALTGHVLRRLHQQQATAYSKNWWEPILSNIEVSLVAFVISKFAQCIMMLGVWTFALFVVTRRYLPGHELGTALLLISLYMFFFLRLWYAVRVEAGR